MTNSARLPTRLLRAILVMACGVVFGSQPVAAQRMMGQVFDPLRFPASGGKVLGFRTAVEVSRHSSVGTTLAEITITPQGTITADRRLVFRFDSTGGELPPRNGLIVDVPVTLSQGSGKQKLSYYLPKWSAGRGMSISVIEDGQVLPDYTGQIGGLSRGRRTLTGLLPSEIQIDWLFVLEKSDSKLRQLQREVRSLAVFDRELPTDWRGFQRFDVVVMNNESLREVASQPPKLDAIRYWVLHGGTLLVLDADTIEGAFETVDFAFRPSDEPDEAIRQAIYTGLKFQQSRVRVSGYDEMIQQVADGLADDVVLELVGAGQVVVVKQDTSLNYGMVGQVMVQIMGYRASPLLRRGVDPLLGSRRFFEWMIPGVAQPPVYTFMGLLTAFVILVGPVAYRRTTKVGRGYLMFAIAPILALATTVAMFGYGIVSDGFGTVVRVRQLTWVDGSSGDAGERVRATYFAGIRPAEGLSFPAGTEVVPVAEVSGIAWEDTSELSPSTMGTVVLRDDEQRFSSAFLPSRQQRQFVSHVPRPNVGFLSITPDPAGIHAPSVQSGFGFALRKMVIRDESGIYWMAEDLQAGEKKLCRPLTDNEASKQLGRMYNDHRPLSEVREQNTSQTRNNRRTYDVLSTLHRHVDRVNSMDDGIFETWLQRQMQTAGEIPNSHFIATADVTSDVLAVEDCELSASIRYVFGTLR